MLRGRVLLAPFVVFVLNVHSSSRGADREPTTAFPTAVSEVGVLRWAVTNRQATISFSDDKKRTPDSRGRQVPLDAGYDLFKVRKTEGRMWHAARAAQLSYSQLALDLWETLQRGQEAI